MKKNNIVNKIINLFVFFWKNRSGIVKFWITIIFSSGFLTLCGLIDYKIKSIQSANELRFNDNELGVIVSEFINEKEYNRYISNDYLSILEIRAKDEGIADFKIKKPNENLKLKIKNFEEAEKVAEKYNSKIIIFGHVNKKGVYPSIHFNKNYREKYNIENISLLKKELFGKDIQNDIEFSSITNDPLLISLYINSVINIEKNKFNEASKNLISLIKKNNNNLYNNYGLYRMLSACYTLSGNFEKSEQILKNKLNLRKDESAAELYLINHYLKNSFISANKKDTSNYISNILKYRNILSWHFWDNFFFNSLEMKLSLEESRYIQKNTDEKLAEETTEILSKSDDQENQLFSNLYKFSKGNEIIASNFLIIKDNDNERISTIKLLSSLDFPDVFRKNSKFYNENFKNQTLVRFFNLIHESIHGDLEIEDLAQNYKFNFKNSFLYQYMYFKRLKEKKRYNESLNVINNLIKTHPEKFFLLKERIFLYIAMEKIKESLDDSNKYLEKYNNDIDVIYQYHYICSLLNDDTCKNTINNYTINFKYYDVNISKIYNDLDKYTEYFPNSELINNIKEIQKKIILGDTKTALELLEKLKIKTDLIWFNNNLLSSIIDYINAIIKFIELDLIKGVSFFQKTQDNFPTKEYRFFDRRNIFLKNQKLELNADQIKNDLLLSLYLIDIMFYDNEFENLLDFLNISNLIYNDNFCSKYELLGKIYFYKNDLKNSESNFLKALNCNENLFFSNYFLGDYYLFSNKNDECKKYLEKSIQLKDDCSQCYLLLSKYYERTGEKEKRKKFRDKGLRLHLNNGKNALDIIRLDWIY